MFVLTGATGGLGSQVLKYLLRLVPPSEIAVSLHNPAGASPLISTSGVELRHGDFTNPETLDEAFKGAEKLLIVSYPSIAHELRVKSHINAIDAARRVGVKHIYYTSLAFGDGSVTAVMKAHLDTEAYLKQSGLTYTIIREGIYSESYPLYFGFFNPGQQNNVVNVPGDGAISWVSREDLGEGTARLMALGGYENQTLLLSGSHQNTLTLQEVATTISDMLSRPITLQIVSVDEYITSNRSDNSPRGSEEFLRAWATTYEGLKRGEVARVDPLIEQLLGRPLKPFETTLRETLGVAEDGGAIQQYAK
ncbi:hypothetical protein JAAARDRAFT_58591 [Jaapia argillacea MUCL 33604]|uniref:NAD(P)-binding domain-containing protein n=1 Tax=Jaapia argillacea MUCL 33604 TaxID=933084 RepID=A0A067PTC7_9AGAM|nr:hypothetical protein JAAARDRAFT_58591 [Jaapia argillacea MUCL 33604]